MSLQQKTLSGLAWTFSQQFSVQLISFFVSVLLARLLSPAEFGLIGMISILISIGTSLMDSGMTSSIIRTPNPDQRDYSTVFYLNIGGSLFIYLLVFFLAPWVASFYKQPELVDIIRVYSVSFIITALMGIQGARLTKEMNFKTQMLIQIPSVIGGGIIGLFLAYKGFGVWSLVWMSLTQNFLGMIQFWIYSSWRPVFIFDKERFKMHFNFGYKITLSGLIETIYQNLYTIVIGKFYSAAQLGYYTRAYTLRQLPVSNISAAINKVTYPMFAAINNDDVKLKEVYKRLMQQVIFWIAPLLILLIVVANPLFRFLLTEKWLPAVPYFQILCITGIIYPLQSYNYNILKVKGRTDISLKIQIIKKVYGITGIFCALPFGIYGLLYFQVICTLIDYNLDCYFGGKMINYPILEQLKDISPTLMISILVGGVSWYLHAFLMKYYVVPDFGMLIIIGCFYFLTYLILSSTIRLSAVQDFKQLLFKR